MILKNLVLIVFFFGLYSPGNAFSREEPVTDLNDLKSVINTCFLKIAKLENELSSLKTSLDTIKTENIPELTTKLENLNNKFEKTLISSGNTTNFEMNKEIKSEELILHSDETGNKKLAKLIAKFNILKRKDEEAFETIQILKEAISELRKNAEKQEIVTQLFEKYLREMPKSENSQEKSLEAQLNVISDIVVKHDKQLVNIENVNTKDQTETIAIEDETIKDDKASALFDIQGYNNLGKGFYSKDISFSLYGSSVRVSGTILNASGKDHSIADIKVMLFDENNNLLWEQGVSILSITNGNSINFNELLTAGSSENIKKYAVVLKKETMPSKLFKFELNEDNFNNNLTAEPLSKNIEKTENVNSYTENKENLVTREIKDEFESIGHDFYVKDLSMSKSELLCNIKGFIKNSSPDFYGLTLFIIQLFDNNQNVIAEKEFTINLLENDLVNFSIDILGVNVKDIDSYKIKVKE